MFHNKNNISLVLLSESTINYSQFNWDRQALKVVHQKCLTETTKSIFNKKVKYTK